MHNNQIKDNRNELPISQIINKYKTSYKKFTPIYSPAIKDEVYFNMPGFKHLIFKNGHRRPNKVIYSRMVLIPLIKPVIHVCDKVIETRTSTEIVKGKPTQATFLALEARVGKSATRVRVIVKKIGNKGKYYFQSVMKYN